MELNILQQYTKATQQRSFYQTAYSNKKVQDSAINFESTRYTTFKIKIEFQVKSEIIDQNNLVQSLESFQKKNPVHNIDFDHPTPASQNLFEDGYWGVKQTADRLANFVILGAGDNLEKMRMGREGIIRGFKEAEGIWGEQLPDISYKTLETALAKIDDRIHSFGKPVIDVAA